MNRPWNFSAGPSALPQEVLQTAAEQMQDWQGTGLSVLEMSHRGAAFMGIHQQAQDDLRQLLGLPDDWAILFGTGGAIGQNAIVPMNLMGGDNARAQADYVVSGSWSEKSAQEARRYGDVKVIASSGQARQMDGQPGQRCPAWGWFPDPASWQIRPGSAYVHFCSNETIGGVEFADWASLPDMAGLGQTRGGADTPLVVDASSNILSRPLDFSKIGLVYAGAQKNAGPAGLTLILIRRELLGRALPICPSGFDYAQMDQAQSMYNTPPTYAIYIAGLVFRWLLAQGGVTGMARRNIAKSQLLYRFIDRSGFYANHVHPDFRSRMNVPFQLTRDDADGTLTKLFVRQATEAGLLELKGHRSVGGMRASLYNALPLQAVQALVDFMETFERRYG